MKRFLRSRQQAEDDMEDDRTKTAEERLKAGEVALLTVKEVNRIGAFLDWGLPKDLFLPYKEMTKELRAGDQILVRLYTDKSGRFAASQKKLYPLLKTGGPYRIGDEVKGRIYEFGHDFGTFVAVDDCYSAMIPRHEDVRAYSVGDTVTVRVTGIKEDGKLDVSLRKKAYEELTPDAEKILVLLREYGGVLPFTEKAEPEVIMRETGMSKAAFKRAVGHLYKERKILLKDGIVRSAASEVIGQGL